MLQVDMHIMEYQILWIPILQYSNPKISFFEYLDSKWIKGEKLSSRQNEWRENTQQAHSTA